MLVENKVPVKPCSSTPTDVSFLLHANDRLQLLENVTRADCPNKTVITKLSVKDEDISKQANMLVRMYRSLLC